MPKVEKPTTTPTTATEAAVSAKSVMDKAIVANAATKTRTPLPSTIPFNSSPVMTIVVSGPWIVTSQSPSVKIVRGD